MAVEIHGRRMMGAASGPTELSMYGEVPTEEITLQQFETLAMDRLVVLKALENARARGLKGPELEDATKKALQSSKCGIERDKRADKIGHHILRLAFCRSEENRRWFNAQETLLFRHRFEHSDGDAIARFFADHKLQYSAIAGEKLERHVQDRLRVLSPQGVLDPGGYYKVEWEEALELVAKRKVYLDRGTAYVGRKDLVSIVVARFRARINRELATTYRMSQNMGADKRIRPLLSSISKHQAAAGPAYKSTALLGAVTAADVVPLSKVSMPLCMQNLQEGLTADSHLKHGGRMQYGLFLKGIGLSLKEALLFWQRAMEKKTAPEKFNKEYAYNIRHNYGQEGKRTQYTPYGCAKNIAAQPTTADHHGCPFRHWDEAHLRAKLSTEMKRRGVEGGDRETTELLKLVKEQHYQIACQRYFTLTHKGAAPDGVGNHPNAYFDASRKWYAAQQQQAAEQAKPGAPAAAAAAAAAGAGAGPGAAAAPTSPARASASGAGGGHFGASPAPAAAPKSPAKPAAAAAAVKSPSKPAAAAAAATDAPAAMAD